jgi:antirestriction protein ArdC
MNRRDITNKIITALEKGVCPWRKTWSNIVHKNQFSGKPYHGINQILLSLNPETAPYWGTFMQWKGAGCSVRKGEKASTVVFFSVLENDEDDEMDDNESVGVPKVKKFPILRYYNVFHLKQVDDPKNKFKNLIETKIESDCEIANKIIKLSGVEIKNGGNNAYYDCCENYIRVPLISQFESEEEYYVTIFHELGHWADKNILGTKLIPNKATSEYAYGELVAELTACFLSRASQLPNDFENQENYIGSWIRGIDKGESAVQMPEKTTRYSDFVRYGRY